MFTTTATSTSNPTNTSQEPKLTLLSRITKKIFSSHPQIPMEDPRKHDKKNTRNMPISINIGAGAGIGGLVLFGGSLVTATLVSALAFNTRRERPSSSDNINKSRSPLETLTADARNPPESAESLPLNLQKPSDDEESIMKETLIKDIQDQTPDENHIAEQLDCEEQVVMAANIESAPPSSEEDSGSEITEREDDGEEQKSSMLNDNENDEKLGTKSLVSDDKTVKSIEEHEAVEEAVQVEKSMALAQAIDHVGEDQETVAASVNHVDVKDNSQLQNLEDEASTAEIKVSVNDDQKTAKEDNPPTKLMNREEEHKDDEKIIKKDELIRKDEIPPVQTIEEEDEDSEDDDGTLESKRRSSIEIEEETTKEAKISIQPKKRRSSVTMRLKNTWRRIKSLDIKRSEGL